MDKVLYNYEKNYEKWRKLLLSTCNMVELYIFIIELGMYFIMKYNDLIIINNRTYIIKYILAPTVLNLLTVIIGNYLEKRIRKDSGRINYIPVLELIAISTIISCTHYIFF